MNSLEQRKETLNTLIYNNHKIVIMGSGEIGEQAYYYIRKHRSADIVLCFCDNDIKKQNTRFHGRPVISPAEAIRNYPDALYLIASEKYYTAMNHQLLEAGINSLHICQFISWFYYSSLTDAEYPKALKIWYWHQLHARLPLENPQTLNEKINWLKIYDSTERKTVLADKYLVRDWIKEKIGSEYLVPLLGVYKRFDDIDFRKLPDRFALKAVHGSGWNIIVPDKSRLNLNDAKDKFDFWMQSNYAYTCGLELHYKNMTPRIIAEQYIENDTNETYDYRFFCFHGVPQAIWVDMDSGRPTHKRNIYDFSWNLLPVKVSYENTEKVKEKPANLDKMIELSKILSQEFAFVRVDFYEINRKIYFGEMTFTPQSGAGRYNPESYNLQLGKLLDLSKVPTWQGI